MIIDRFLQHISNELNLSPLTVKAYAKDLEQFVAFLTCDKEQLQVASVTTGDVRAWIVELSRQGDGASTVRRKIQAVRAFYKFLMKRGKVEFNPALELELTKVPKQLPHFVRETTMDVLLAETADEEDFEAVRNRLMLMMLYETGMRRAELIGLLDSNVDTAKCCLKVHGKRNKERIIPFGDKLRDAVEHYRKVRDTQVARGCETFFVTTKANPLYPTLVYRVVHSTLASAGATGKKSPHVLRHTFASVMLNEGAQLNSVKELLGHESLAATQVYTHISFSELKNNYKLAHPRALKKGG